MKTRLLIATFAGVLFASLFSATAQEARFFRIVGPVPTAITEVTPGGWVTWEGGAERPGAVGAERGTSEA